MSGFLGLRGTGDFVTDQRPKNWRETILHLFPNGTAPLTALTALMASEKTDDPEFNWWTKTLPSQRASVTGVFTDSALVTAYAGGATAGTILYFQTDDEGASHFRVGTQVLARNSADLDVDVVGKAVEVVRNGASSYVAVSLLEADDNSTNNLTTADVLLNISDVNPEGGESPDPIAYDPIKLRNYTQIVRTPLWMTRTALRTRLRTGDQYKEAKREALELHGMSLEREFLWSIPTELTGANGKPERTTGGVIYFARTYAPSNIKDFKKDYVGNTWLSKGDEFIDHALEQWFRYGTTPLALCGSGALLGLQNLAKNYASFQVRPAEDIGYGFKVSFLSTSFGDVPLKVHPLLSHEPTTRNLIIIIQPSHIRYRYVDDTKFYGQKDDMGFSSAGKRIDGRFEEFLTEAGLEYHHPETIMILRNVGVDG